MLGEGNYDGAVGHVRLVVESLRGAHLYEKGKFLEGWLDQSKVDHFGTIASRVLELAARLHHDYGQATNFSRAQAKSLLRIATCLVEVAAEALAQKPLDDTGSGH